MRQSRRLFGQKVLAVASSPLVFSLPSFAATYPESQRRARGLGAAIGVCATRSLTFTKGLA